MSSQALKKTAFNFGCGAAFNFNSPVSFVLKTHAELDLTNQAAVQEFFTAERLTQVY
jgi:hypothetical protein